MKPTQDRGLPDIRIAESGWKRFTIGCLDYVLRFIDIVAREQDRGALRDRHSGRYERQLLVKGDKRGGPLWPRHFFDKRWESIEFARFGRPPRELRRPPKPDRRGEHTHSTTRRLLHPKRAISPLGFPRGKTGDLAVKWRMKRPDARAANTPGKRRAPVVRMPAHGSRMRWTGHPRGSGRRADATHGFAPILIGKSPTFPPGYSRGSGRQADATLGYPGGHPRGSGRRADATQGLSQGFRWFAGSKIAWDRMVFRADPHWQIHDITPGYSLGSGRQADATQGLSFFGRAPQRSAGGGAAAARARGSPAPPRAPSPGRRRHPSITPGKHHPADPHSVLDLHATGRTALTPGKTPEISREITGKYHRPAAQNPGLSPG
eukprot:gene15445-biopygen4546